MTGKPLPCDNLTKTLDLGLLTHPALERETKEKSLKKSKDRDRRKSLLQWPTIVARHRSKSKERQDPNSSTSEARLSTTLFRARRSSQVGASPLLRRKNSSVSDKSDSQSQKSSRGEGKEGKSSSCSSEHSCDREPCVLTRVILPDRATTVVNTTTGETIRALILR